MNKPVSQLALIAVFQFAVAAIGLDTQQISPTREQRPIENQPQLRVSATREFGDTGAPATVGHSPLSAIDYPGYDSGRDIYCNASLWSTLVTRGRDQGQTPNSLSTTSSCHPLFICSLRELGVSKICETFPYRIRIHAQSVAELFGTCCSH